MTLRYSKENGYFYDVDTLLVEGTTDQFHILQAREPYKQTIVIRDIDPYRSPIDGRVIGSRREKREDLKRHNCREYEPSERTNWLKERGLHG